MDGQSAPPMLGSGGVWALCERLRGEKLMVTSELSAVRQLHESIEERMHQLGLLAWSTKLHQWTLSGLIGSHASVQPECTFAMLATIDAAQLEPAYRRLGHHHSTVAAVLNGLLASPRGVAELLHATDTTPANADAPSSSTAPLPVGTEELTRALHSLLYGHCVFPGDETLLVEVLCSLVHLQMVPAADPRLVLRRGTAAFPRLLRLMTDGLYAVKVFLTEALHDSVMLVLCQDDHYLDIDVNKMMLRFPAAMREHKFGADPTTAEYERRVSAHRRNVVEKLVLLTHSFIKGIVDALHSLPASLVWLVQQLHAALVDGKRLQQGQASLICTDLLVTNLLCVAISNPETYGIISDTPVSPMARSNLIQIGQLVQVLALSRHEPPPSLFQVFTRQFEESPIIGVVDRVLALSLPPMEGGLTGTASASDGGKDGERYAPMQARCEDPIRRTHFIGSIADVNTIVAAVQGQAVAHITEAGLSKELRSLGRRLPSVPFSSAAAAADKSTTSPQSSVVSRSGTLRNLAEKMQTAAGSRGRPSSGDGRREELPIPPEMVDVVVFTLGDDNDEKIGLRSEESFMEISGLRRRKKRNSEGNEKRTRFLEEESSYVGSAPSECTTEGGSDTGEEEEDEGEAMGDDDAASLASSGEREGEEGHEDRLLALDEEDGASTLPDNVSEMGAMSGRASPSLSGRDTPDGGESTIAAAGASSTVDGGAREVAAREALLPRLPVTVRKQNAEGLEEKFGKFSLPPTNHRSRYRDDQRSLLSDSWSTDVAPSDNEGPTLMLPQGPPMYQLMPGGAAGAAAAAAAAAGGVQQAAGGAQARQARSGSLRNGSTTGGEDKSDTWSLDAVASDSEADRNDRSDIAPIPVPMGPPLNSSGGGGGVGEMALNGGNGGLGGGPSGGMPRMEEGRMRRQSSGSSFYSEEGRRGSGGPVQLPVSKPTSEVGEDSGHHPPLPEMNSISPPSGQHHHDNGLEMAEASPSGGLKGKFSIEMRSKKAAILQGLHRIGDKMKRGSNSAVGSMRGSATMGDFPSMERTGGGGGGVDERRGGSSGDLLSLDEPSPDDILAKYQRGGARSGQQQPVVLVDLSDSRDDLQRPPDEMAPPLPVQSPPVPLAAYYSPENLTQCAAFADAKRKLRFVLSGVGFLPTWCATSTSRDKPRGDDEAKEELIALLQVFLAEAVNGRERALCAQIRETIRCLGVFSAREVRKLVRSLKEDHRRRASYTLYLQQSRLSLLRLQAALERLTARVRREKSLTEECLVEMWINRYYLPIRQPPLLGLLEPQFAALKAQDEKTEWVQAHIDQLCRALEAEPAFRLADEKQREYARRCVERTLMARIYHMAFYPNVDADYHRDEVLYKALQRLASAVSPDHGLMVAIPEALRGECPWPSAQHEIAVINAFKSPRDKLACIIRACETISNLMALTSSRQAASADDITPVLVYVVVMANPAALLSNVQYVNGFYASQLSGPEAYAWTSFNAAIDYIKTLL